MNTIKAGFIPLLDAAILIVAREQGFAEARGIGLDLMRETSWANIRDRVSVGQFDVAHVPAPLPVAQNLGLSPLAVPMIAPFALGLGGNAVTVSRSLFEAMQHHGADRSGDPHRAGNALREVVRARSAPLVLAVVHDFSSHAYELRYWLAACGIDPRHDVKLTVLPPPTMSDAIASGTIDGYCAGEPWNSVSEQRRVGVIVTTKASIWQSSPEKVLGLRARWADENAGLLAQLLLALHDAALWCADPGNRERLAGILAQPRYLGLSPDILHRGLDGRVLAGGAQDDFLLFEQRAANFPWQSHALWFYAQMVRWGQVAHSAQAARTAFETYRPDLYRAALRDHGVALPGASAKVEGALRETLYVPAAGGRIALGPDGFFDGVIFDPDRVDGYIASSPFYGALHND
jgi:NitT/TauT family transport system ATP-binding protein